MLDFPDLLKRQPKDPWVSIVKVWTPETVEWAMAELIDGRFHLAGMLLDALPAYDAYITGMNTLISSVQNLPWRFESASQDPYDVAIAALATNRLDLLLPKAFVSDLVRDGSMLCASVGRIGWELKHGLGWPTFKRWHPSHLWFDQIARIFMAQTQSGISRVDGEDGWYVFLPQGERGWVNGFIRAIAIPFVASLFSVRDWMRWCEVHGNLLKLARVPRSGSDSARASQFIDDCANVGNESVIECPTGDTPGTSYDCDILAAGNEKSWESFERVLEIMHKRTTQILLGQNLTTEVAGAGSLAAARVHENVKKDLSATIGDGIADFWNAKIGPQWAKYNFRREPPKLTCEPLKPEAANAPT